MPQRPSEPQPRKFEYSPAVRKAVPLLVGLNSPSGGGKTFSALRLATGIQRVVGGDIAGIDTEANRMLHYADKFKFHHIPFGPPFSPYDYLDVLEFVVAKGAKTIVLDSASHLHDGPGGILEMHAVELERMGGDEKNNFRAWAKPKSQLRQFINAMTTGLGKPELALNLIFCFRAKEKLKISGKDAEKLGLQPIADPELRFEMTTNILLYNGARGVPTWTSPIRGEMDIIKLPDQFEHMFGVRSQLDEEIGQKMATWSTGGDAPKAAAQKPQLAANAAKWIEFWGKRAIGVERVLATIGKTSVELMDDGDLKRFDGFVKQLKAREATAEQLFASAAPPPDEEEPEDEKGDEPTEEELADAEAAKTGNGARAGA
jgi:hypothetical protein